MVSTREKKKNLYKKYLPAFYIFLAILIDRTHYFSFLKINLYFTFPIFYYWALERPNFLSAFQVFFLGIFDDTLSGEYLGQNTLEMILIYVFINLQREYIYHLSFISKWFLFAIVACIALFMEWGLASLFRWTFMPLEPLFPGYISTIVLYPFIIKLFHQLNTFKFLRV